jgi:hypothetical protein
LFKKAKRKNISVSKALTNNTWIAHILPLNSIVEVQEYLLLWEVINSIERDETMEDQITWRWTANDEYTAKSAY